MSSLLEQIDLPFIIESLIKIAIVFVMGLLSPVSMNWVERRLLAVMQNRLGPNRVGPFGLLQSVADGIKFLFKEDIIPLAVNKWLYVFAPVVAVIPAFMATIVYPLGPAGVELPFISQLIGKPVDLFVTHFNVALLYVLAVTSLGVYGIVLGGWASNSKYSLLGGLRSSAQMISYELALSLSLIAVIIHAGSLDLTKIVEQQATTYWFGLIPKWNIIAIPFAGLFAFIIYLISAIAETNRVPFDLPEAETELVAGFHTEYSSSLKFAMFFMAEYVNMLTVSVLASALFLGGWSGPGVNALPWLGPLYFLFKVLLFMLLYIWLRGTLPRFRYDQLMNFGWKFLLPAALLNLVFAAVLGVMDWHL
ncbi:MAG TPA: NADH-quinone oxidoreductase subunit NuoH [Blastocatellia bacterium]|nr:NADH-quinone oxidoreductase subunit NuoH [Blastocatellia bacterium]